MEPKELLGRVLDARYQLQEIAGVGGTAVVYRAQDLLLRRTVAVKVLWDGPPLPPPEGAGQDAQDRQAARRLNRDAFFREAVAASALAHPGIVTVYDVCRAPTPYIVMEYVAGKSLATRMAEGPIPYAAQLSITLAVLEALHAAHMQGIVHRDIKPQNILLSDTGEVKVTDFGIAGAIGQNARQGKERVLGTTETISPEQAMGHALDARSDLYSLGAVMYRMATGHPPFEDDDPETVAFLHVHEVPRYPSTWNPCVAKGWEQIILCALEKSPARRFGTARAMREAVLALQKDPDRTFRRFSTARTPGITEKLSRRPLLLSLLLGVALGGVLLCLTLVLNQSYAGSPVTIVEVPALVGTVYVPEGEALWPTDTRITVSYTYVFRADLPEGTVLAQSAAAGTLWKLDGPEDQKELQLTLSTQRPLA